MLFPWMGLAAGLMLGFPQTNGLLERAVKAKVELFVSAPAYAEGPTWRRGELFFCANGLMRVTRDRRVVRYLDLNPSGTYLLADGRILLCDNKYHAILQIDMDGRVGVIADSYEGKPLRSLNDLTVDREGNIYWTDPNSSDPRTPDGNVYRVTPQGRVDRIASRRAFPNGLEIDLDSRYLYLIESANRVALRYDLPPADKPLGEPTVFYRYKTLGDGCAFDAQGNFWTTEFAGGEALCISPQGRLLASVKIPAQAVSNLTFGGKNRDKLFVTTGLPDAVYRISVGVQGFAGHPGARYRILRTLNLFPPVTAGVRHQAFGIRHQTFSIRR